MPKGDEKTPKGVFSQEVSELGWFNKGSGTVIFPRKARKRASDGCTRPPQSDEWGRLNRQKVTKGDQKGDKSAFSVPINDKKAVYWPLSEHILATFWPAFAESIGKTRHFRPEPGRKVSRNMTETGPGGPVSSSQTKQRVFWPKASRTLF